eukprot:6490718-Amphidinium_carterae.1
MDLTGCDPESVTNTRIIQLTALKCGGDSSNVAILERVVSRLSGSKVVLPMCKPHASHNTWVLGD